MGGFYVHFDELSTFHVRTVFDEAAALRYTTAADSKSRSCVHLLHIWGVFIVTRLLLLGIKSPTMLHFCRLCVIKYYAVCKLCVSSLDKYVFFLNRSMSRLIELTTEQLQDPRVSYVRNFLISHV